MCVCVILDCMIYYSLQYAIILYEIIARRLCDCDDEHLTADCSVESREGLLVLLWEQVYIIV